VKTNGSIDRTREIDGRMEESPEFFTTNLLCKVRHIARHLRADLSIENSRQHVLDVTLKEDASRIRKGTGQEICSIVSLSGTQHFATGHYVQSEHSRQTQTLRRERTRL